MNGASVTLKAVGDLGLNAGIGELIARNGPMHPFGRTGECLAGADLLFGNLEMPLAPASAAPAWPEVLESFRAEPAHAAALKAAGFGVVSLANNHVMDFGAEGLRATRQALARLEIPHVGAGESLAEARRPVIVEVNGLRLGFLAYAQPGRHCAEESSPGAAPIRPKLIAEDLAALAVGADVRIVSLHFGQVYSDYPAPADRALAHGILDAGADLILGHHPHVVQGVERRGRGLVAYSLGEFLFDPACGYVVSRVGAEARRNTVVLSVRLGRAGVQEHALLPLRVADDLRPAALEGEERAEAERRLAGLSAAAGADDGALFSSQMATRTVSHQKDVFLHHLRHGNIGILARWVVRVRPRHIVLFVRSLLRRR